VTPDTEPPDTCKLLFAVSDTGVGIAHSEMDKLFEAFTQTETGQQAQEGTGLGLVISRKFVQLMGGDITVESPPSAPPIGGEVKGGPGATFSFDIQVQVVEETEIETKRPTRRVIGLEPDQPRYRILIVDDSGMNRQLLIKLLSPLGFELREAENGQEAIEVWEEFEPHLIWMDMRMPVLDGYEATKQIKATTKGQATAIIALTASSLEEERAVVLSAGCDDFMRKPFREADIFEAMSKHIGVRYVYEEDSKIAESPGRGEKLEFEDLKSEMAILPIELLASLEEATELSDMEMVNQVVAEIRSRNASLADVLARLADNFEYDKIFALLQEAGRKK
jgi:CheY-like chemotaxis protein